MAPTLSPFLTSVSRDWSALNQIIQSTKSVELDGSTLDIPSVIAIACYNRPFVVNSCHTVLKAVEESVEVVNRHLLQGQTIYGVNTGVGTSADTRTAKVVLLQKSLVQHQNVGVLTSADTGKPDSDAQLPQLGGGGRNVMPVEWTRAMMLIRCNSLLRGHSGVRLSTISAITDLSRHGIVPVVPLRGSISASGDLSPLSYLAGTLEGNHDIFAYLGPEYRQTVAADQALKQSNLEKVEFGPKEALGLMNGTAASCAAATLSLYHARYQTLLSQVITAMATEALLGSKHNYDKFISEARPHPGQAEVAATLTRCLSGSRLVADRDPQKIGLFQDRYALRTAAQWIGPQLEDILLAEQQIRIELNSTTDNPLVDVANNIIHHGGNFQATSVTSAMQKVLNALQMLGRLIYAQCSELLNSTMNKGLPPNLCFDDPSASFTFKGMDVSMAAYMSELAYIAHPIGNFVQSAELHNQSVNSLALLAARHVSDASFVLDIMAANILYALCQALDLRCLHIEFITATEPIVAALHADVLGTTTSHSKEQQAQVSSQLWRTIVERWVEQSSLDIDARAMATAGSMVADLVSGLSEFRPSLQNDSLFNIIKDYKTNLARALVTNYEEVRRSFLQKPTTTSYIGRATRKIYDFIRQDLAIPIHEGVVEHPTILGCTSRCAGCTPEHTIHTDKVTLGTQIGKILAAIKSEHFQRVLMEATVIYQDGVIVNTTK